MNCTYCGKMITEEIMESLTRHQKEDYKRTGRWYCSRECSRKYVSLVNSKRMKENNPMSMPGIKEKMIKTLNEMIEEKKANGEKWFKVRGGNGKGYTVPQITLKEQLEDYGPQMEYVVPTKVKRGNGYPTCYKIDIALPDYMVAIEVDGESHNTIERQNL